VPTKEPITIFWGSSHGHLGVCHTIRQGSGLIPSVNSQRADGGRRYRSGGIPYQRRKGKSTFDTKLSVDTVQVKFDGSFANV